MLVQFRVIVLPTQCRIRKVQSTGKGLQQAAEMKPNGDGEGGADVDKSTDIELVGDDTVEEVYDNVDPEETIVKVLPTKSRKKIFSRVLE